MLYVGALGGKKKKVYDRDDVLLQTLLTGEDGEGIKKEEKKRF